MYVIYVKEGGEGRMEKKRNGETSVFPRARSVRVRIRKFRCSN